MLGEVIARGAKLPAAQVVSTDDTDPLSLLVYTSGSTGAPKGAMYTESMVAESWRRSAMGRWGDTGVHPSISLNFMPMSHVMGRGLLYATLGVGGTAYFAARSDLSTFLEDLALVRPTQLNFVPRVWDMIFAEVAARTGPQARRPGRGAVPRPATSLLGGRYVHALTGSAPISPEMSAFVEELLDLHLIDGYGSTEAGAILVDGRLERPPVLDYKLVDVPDLGYFRTDRPHPRGELLVKTEGMFPGYYKRPELTAEMFDADGFYRTGDIFAETGPDQLVYLDRRNNVLKLSQGEFVTVSKLEAAFGDSPLVRQIYVYGNSARSYLLAVVVPTDDALAHYDAAELKSADRRITCRMSRRQRDCSPTRSPVTSHRDHAVHTRERPADRNPQAGAAQAQGALRRTARAALRRAGRRSGRRAAGSCAKAAPTDRCCETVIRAAGALLGASAADRASPTRTSPISAVIRCRR